MNINKSATRKLHFTSHPKHLHGVQWDSFTFRTLSLATYEIFNNGKPELKSQTTRTRHRWEDNIKIQRNGRWWERVNWIHLKDFKLLELLGDQTWDYRAVSGTLWVVSIVTTDFSGRRHQYRYEFLCLVTSPTHLVSCF